MYAAVWADDAGTSTDLQTFRKRNTQVEAKGIPAAMGLSSYPALHCLHSHQMFAHSDCVNSDVVIDIVQSTSQTTRPSPEVQTPQQNPLVQALKPPSAPHIPDWQWEKHKKQPEEYHRILRCFLDRKDCCYSIHQMAQMGVGEGKSIGEWFGPNTVAQVLKKLALFDEWNSLAVYVSMDNTVVIEDIKKMCWSPPQSSGAAHSSAHLHRSALGRNKNTAGFCTGWKPLLLIIPLRLGINHINPVYIDAFKECFKMPQSLGALGGKPNNAYYFIGFLGNELIYLDPHTTQSFVDSEENGTVDDQSFHCQQAPHRMKIMNLDPSVALGFFCKEECDFDNWCSLVQKEILKQQSLRMFELVQKHPPHWPPFIPPTKPEVTTTGAELIESTDKLFELEEEFEILSV
ncbi:cysteine protease ATG4A isoform X1 [Mycteria americana]|uniref:cysteine protease ATG4A isoform X1 n=1 Tax=Mycteria americana TaxID=33587 RepID=UPI003F586488